VVGFGLRWLFPSVTLGQEGRSTLEIKSLICLLLFRVPLVPVMAISLDSEGRGETEAFFRGAMFEIVRLLRE